MRKFTPTNEWQPVLPSDVLQPGLEIRMDMKTGLNYARLRQPKVAPMPWWRRLWLVLMGERGL